MPFFFISREQSLVSKALFDNPKPIKVSNVAKSRRTQNWINAISPNIHDVLGICKGLKDITGNIRNLMNRIENACQKLIGPNFDDFSMTGIHLLSDSINV